MRNIHDLSSAEVLEVVCDASVNYMATGDADAFAVRLVALGVDSSEIKEQLLNLNIRRKEAFNQKLAELAAHHNKGRAA